MLALGMTKRPVDIVADYLSSLNAHLQYHLKWAYPQSLSEKFGNEILLKYCITVPAVCYLDFFNVDSPLEYADSLGIYRYGVTRQNRSLSTQRKLLEWVKAKTRFV